MKYIKLFEKYSLPKSVDKLSNILMDELTRQLDRWVMRKSLANWTDDILVEVPYKDEDFPVRNIKLSLSIVLTDKFGFNRSGTAYFYDNRYNNFVTPKINDDGTTDIGISIKIYVPFNKKSFSEKENREEMYDMIIHELLHVYQYYKIESKKLVKSKDNIALMKTIMELFKLYYDCKFSKYLYIFYIALSKDEKSAHLSQMHTKGGDYWVKNLNRMYNMSFDELKTQFIFNFDDQTEEESRKDFYNNFIESYEFYQKDYEDYTNKKFNNCKSFDDILSLLYNMFQHKKRDLKNKVNKILYSK